MGLAVGLQELPQVEMRIFLGRRQALVAEELLDDAEVCAPAQEVRSEGVAQGMRADLPADGGAPEVLPHSPLH